MASANPRAAIGLCLLGLSLSCGGGELDAAPAKGEPATRVVKADPSDVPVHGVTADERVGFFQGDKRFDDIFHDPDGAGPVYIRRSCGECHEGAAKGPGNVRKMFVVGEDGAPLADQSKLPWGHTERPFAVGATDPITIPDDPSVRVTTRIPPAVFGRGFVEAIADADIEAQEAAQAARSDGIHGRVHRVPFQSEMSAEPSLHTHVKGDANLIGRFGLKARIATLDDFTADAFQGDMGITSPLRPDEVPNPGGLADDLKPGVDVDLETLRITSHYMRLLAIPPRDVVPGAELFSAAKCAVCHVSDMRTRKDHPIAALRDVPAPIFSDLLLHDLGAEMSDGAIDGLAGPRDWKTAPLIGLRFFKSFLHDGRAKSLRAAVLGHGGSGSEAQGSVDAFLALDDASQEALLAYVESL